MWGLCPLEVNMSDKKKQFTLKGNVKEIRGKSLVEFELKLQEARNVKLVKSIDVFKGKK